MKKVMSFVVTTTSNANLDSNRVFQEIVLHTYIDIITPVMTFSNGKYNIIV
jgi:hypothetical protein